MEIGKEEEERKKKTADTNNSRCGEEYEIYSEL